MLEVSLFSTGNLIRMGGTLMNLLVFVLYKAAVKMLLSVGYRVFSYQSHCSWQRRSMRQAALWTTCSFQHLILWVREAGTLTAALLWAHKHLLWGNSKEDDWQKELVKCIKKLLSRKSAVDTTVHKGDTPIVNGQTWDMLLVWWCTYQYKRIAIGKEKWDIEMNSKFNN